MKITFYVLGVIILISNNLFAQVDSQLWNQDQLSNATVLLYQPINDTTGKTGSGTIISHENRYFLLTANHIANIMNNNAKIVFRLTGDKPGIFNLVQIVKNNILGWIHHPIADISIIELVPQNKNIQDMLFNRAFPIKLIYNGKELPSSDADITFFGYPMIDMELEHFSPLVFTGNLASGLITQKRADTKTKCNFYYLNVPSIEGCSGSGVYFSVKKAIYTGGKTTLMVGIVHGTQGDSTGGKLAAITPSYYLFDLFKK